jgi:DNA-directed RNA polymerase specialized sigma24 family protein
MVQDHLDAVWRAALAASADHAVAEEVTTAVLRAAPRDAAQGELVRRAVLAAVRRAPAPALARMGRAEREAVALARLAGCPVGDVAAALGIGDGAARRLLTAGLRSMPHRRPASAPRTLPPALGCGIAVS